MDSVTKNIVLSPFNLLYKVNPKLTLKILFKIKQGYKLDLKNPKTYNEKLQWIKLYDKNSLMPICCDKFTVREYINQIGCADILNNLIRSTAGQCHNTYYRHNADNNAKHG